MGDFSSFAGSVGSGCGRRFAVIILAASFLLLAFVIGRMDWDPGPPRRSVYVVRAQGECWRTEAFILVPGGIQFVDQTGRRVAVLGSYSLSDR